MNSKSLDLIRDKTLLATTSDDLLTVMHAGWEHDQPLFAPSA
jgi:hypothetical protein